MVECMVAVICETILPPQTNKRPLTKRAEVTHNPGETMGSSLRSRGLFWGCASVREKEFVRVTGAERPRWSAP